MVIVNNSMFEDIRLLSPSFLIGTRARENMAGVNMVLAYYPRNTIPQDLYNPCMNFMNYARTMFTPTMCSRRKLSRQLSEAPASILYYTILYYTILYYTILYYTNVFTSPRHAEPLPAADRPAEAQAHRQSRNIVSEIILFK